jgi:predicted NAD-dependent protein-ADP-ribosyltransferase YbiA (DUF1768 family)
MTEPATPTPAFRIVSSTHGDRETFVPMNDTQRSRAVLQRLLDGPTPSERKRWGRDAARREAKRREELTSGIARHTVMSGEHRDHRVVSALLEAHQPKLVEVDGKWYAECHGCPTYWEHSEYEESQEVHHEWPCPTWTTIAGQSGA